MPACRWSSSTATRFPEHGSVESNDEVGARAAARHLLRARPPRVRGHRHRAAEHARTCSSTRPGPTEIVASRRLTGYRQGLELGGVQLGDERIVVGPATFDGGVAAFRRIWEDGLRPTAVLAMSDVMAIGVDVGRARGRPARARRT